VSLARKQERMRRETVGATLLAVSRWLREDAKCYKSEPIKAALLLAADKLEDRVKGVVSGTNEQKEAG
jgi:hypothetical protein